jgi:hypothetical protein
MRKRWTPKTEVTDSLLKFREKRKWQIALRRYVLEKQRTTFYAPYFGLDIPTFRKWIEIQFNGDLNWENFSSAWQFDHIVPVTYFDFNDDKDLRLCWNFINIRVERLDMNKNRGNRVDVLAAKTYFETIFLETGYSLCQKMVEKIDQIEVSQIQSSKTLENFIQENKPMLDTLATFGVSEFDKLNDGMPLKDILAEKELFKKFGN